MAMSPRLLRPRQTIHPETASWASRVVANGASVSGTTLSAVDKFVKACYANNIRDRFYRLNLFCGTGLNACLVPLFRGPTQSGTQFGNSTDTNNGPFLPQNYVETGATGGLVGNGTTKYLDTGFPMNSLPSTTSGHAAVYCPNRSSVVGFAGMIGCAVTGTTGFGISTDTSVYGIWGSIASAINSTDGFLLASRTSSSLLTTYVNGTSIATSTTSVTPSANANNATVFANRAGPSSVNSYDSRRYCFYSIGTGLSQSDVTALTTAVQAFQTALRRNV